MRFHAQQAQKKILNGLYFNKGELETAKDRIRKLSEIVDTTKQPGFDQDDCQPSSFKADIIRQKEEMINCLQDELIKVRLREAENEESIRNLGEKVSELEEVCIFFFLIILFKNNFHPRNVSLNLKN